MLALFLVSLGRAQEIMADNEMSAARRFGADALFDSSIAHYGRAQTFLVSSPRRDLYFQCCNGIIDALLRKAQFAQAETLALRTEDEVRKELGEDNRVLAETYCLIGYVRTVQDRYGEAIAFYNRGLAIREKLFPPDDPLEASLRYGLGVVYSRQGQFDAALESLSRAEAIRQRNVGENPADLASTLIMIGYVLDQNCEPAKAMEAYSQALDALRAGRLEASPSSAACHHYLAFCYRSLGRFEEAAASERKALALARKLYGDNQVFVASSLGQLGDYLVEAGDFDTAEQNYDESLSIFRAALGPDHSSVHEIERKIARLYAARKEYDKALAVDLRVVASHAVDFGAANPDLGFLYEEVAQIYQKMGDGRKACEYYGRALRLRASIAGSRDRLDKATLLWEMAGSLSSTGMYDSASVLLDRSLAMQDSAGFINPVLKSSTLAARAGLDEHNGSLSGALRLYQEALMVLCPGFHDSSLSANPPSPGNGHDLEYAGLLTAKAGALLRVGRSMPGVPDCGDLALSTYSLSTEAVSKVRDSYRSEGSKLALQEDMIPLYESAIAAAADLYGRTGAERCKKYAFSFMERTKAAVLLDGIRQARAKHFVGLPDRLIEKERILQGELRALENRIEESTLHGDSASASRFRKRFLATTWELDRTGDTLGRIDPRFHDLYCGDRQVTPLEVQKLLDPETCLLEYSVCRTGGYVAVIRHGSFEVLSLGPQQVLDSVAHALRRSLRKLDGVAYRSTARKLYALLIKPLCARLSGLRHLVIIPDGPLYYVPFEVLLSSGPRRAATKDPETDFSRLPYLVKKYDISYAMSAALYCESKVPAHHGKLPAESFAGFAPVFRDRPSSAMWAEKDGPENVDLAAVRSITLAGNRFGELPFSGEEVESIAAAFRARGRRGLCAVDSNATEEFFKANASRYSVLHIATHGYLDEAHPGLSGLLFSPGADSSSGEAGVLHAGDIYGLHLDADLVVLSSCESGLGKLVRGEGLMALTRGFLYAGARNIVYTLWSVQDRRSSALMQKFYGKVLGGSGYSAALRAAKLDMIKESATANPFKWAGFVLMGE